MRHTDGDKVRNDDERKSESVKEEERLKLNKIGDSSPFNCKYR